MNPISYQRNLRKMQRQRAKTLSAYRKARDKASREERSSNEIEELIHEEMFEIRIVDDEIESLESRYLIECAQKLVLPIPAFSDADDIWQQSEITGRFRLSKKAMVELRSTVRKERKERREGAVLWFAMITGVIGAMTGLLAIWKS